MEGCRHHPPPGTLPHPLENATRFPQPTGPRDGEGRREEDCTVLIVAGRTGIVDAGQGGLNDLLQLQCGLLEELLAFARSLLLQQRVAASDQPLARELRTVDLAKVSIVKREN